MTCAEALRAILEANRSDLEGRGEGNLAKHLAGCQRCRGLSRAILDGEGALAQGLAAAVAPPNLDQLIDRALDSPPGGRTVPFRARSLSLALLPVAAAAAMVFLFLGSDPQLPGDPYLPTEQAPGLGLEVPEGHNVAVLATNDPRITVLWIY